MASEPSQDLGPELARIASELNAIAGLESTSSSTAPGGGEPMAHRKGQRAAALPATSNLARAQARYDERRKRDAIFQHPELFGEPAWDIMLDLYIAQAKGRDVSVSSACIGSAAPPTTGLRWLGLLQESGLVTRSHDANDQRRILVRLSADGIACMEKFLLMTTQNHDGTPSAQPPRDNPPQLEPPPTFVD